MGETWCPLPFSPTQPATRPCESAETSCSSDGDDCIEGARERVDLGGVEGGGPSSPTSLHRPDVKRLDTPV